MTPMLALIKKEITDALKNKLFLIILGMLLLLTIVSVVLGSYQVRINMDTYNQSVSFLKSLGKTEFPDAPNLNPLSSSKSFVNYIGLLGALLAIVLGNAAVVKEKRNGTLKLILSRQIFRDTFLNGKILGNMILLFFITLLTSIITLGSVAIISTVSLSAGDISRMFVFFFMSFLYMAFFLILGIFMSVLMPNGNKALLITVIIWLVISFILPQIGDTMDMDNQLPGGFFSSMGMNKEDTQKILDHFKIYETIRDSIEQMSPTKHYERVGFALLNIKPGFDKNTVLEVVLMKWIDVLGLLAPSIILWLCSYMVFLKRENIYQE
ncbi:MAG TPA: ABC transporter permease [Mobilitalea sp.]|nr:ABC transporter permease [Mobilitalea sp.]